MREIKIGGMFNASEIALGVMRIISLSSEETDRHIRTAVDEGVNFFDTADIYKGGRSDIMFGQAVRNVPGLRDKIIVQSKSGICKGTDYDHYNLSKEHILESVEGSLKRLQMDYIDVLLLHRPDALMEPEEVAEAFDRLYQSGKVRYFGVSNQTPMQIELLSKYVHHKIVANQLQFSIAHTGMVDFGLFMNTEVSQSIDWDGGILDYCRLKDITVQAWSPFQYGVMEGVFLDNPEYKALNEKINEIAAAKGVPNTAIAAAWILRHPAKMQVVAGTMNTQRLKDICKASTIELSREEWYAIYFAAGNKVP